MSFSRKGKLLRVHTRQRRRMGQSGGAHMVMKAGSTALEGAALALYFRDPGEDDFVNS